MYKTDAIAKDFPILLSVAHMASLGENGLLIWSGVSPESISRRQKYFTRVNNAFDLARAYEMAKEPRYSMLTRAREEIIAAKTIAILDGLKPELLDSREWKEKIEGDRLIGHIQPWHTRHQAIEQIINELSNASSTKLWVKEESECKS